MTTYSLDPITGKITRDDGSIIPQDDTIQAYKDYENWLAEGNSPTYAAASALVAENSFRLTKLEFINKFTDTEYCAILDAADKDVRIRAWMKKLELTTADVDGTSIDLRDPRTVAGVQAIVFLLGQLGVIPSSDVQSRIDTILAR